MAAAADEAGTPGAEALAAPSTVTGTDAAAARMTDAAAAATAAAAAPRHGPPEEKSPLNLQIERLR